MLYDLSVSWSPAAAASDVESTLAMSAELGYDVVALDHVYTAVPTVVDAPSKAFAASFTSTTSTTTTTTTTPSGTRPQILHRATVVVSDVTTNYRLAAVAAAYDIVAVRPTTEKAFQAACLNMAEPALISLDLTAYFPFYFKHRVCMAAVRRGLHFEVCYAQALRAPPRGRALFVANLCGLVRATRGRGLVVSSGALSAHELRAPADVVNLLAVWGLAPDRGTDALAALPRSIVANEGLRRRGFRGAIDLHVPGAAADGTAGQPVPKQKQKQKGQPKRKAEDGAGAKAQTKKQRQ